MDQHAEDICWVFSLCAGVARCRCMHVLFVDGCTSANPRANTLALVPRGHTVQQAHASPSVASTHALHFRAHVDPSRLPCGPFIFGQLYELSIPNQGRCKGLLTDASMKQQNNFLRLRVDKLRLRCSDHEV
eukprot:88613-Pelagomonas_calceolata.AAC.1